MPIDSEKKRKAAQGLPFAPTPPVPDGTIDDEDRAALAGVYGTGLFGGESSTLSRVYRARYHPKVHGRYRGRYN